MAKYVDADALCKSLGDSEEDLRVKEYLASAPIALVRPPLYADWIQIYNSTKYKWMCSKCRSGSPEAYLYCPSCGAKMGE